MEVIKTATKTKSKTVATNRIKDVEKKASRRSRAVDELTNGSNGSVDVRIKPLSLGKVRVKVVGTSPLVVQNFGKKQRTEMLEKQMRSTGAKAKNPPRCPEDEFLNSFYVVKGELPLPNVDKDTGIMTYKPADVAKFIKNATFGIPAVSFRNALISACRNADYQMSAMRQTIAYVRPVGSTDPTMCVIESSSPPVMDSRICRIGKKIPMERFRPMWSDWSTTIEIEYDSSNVSASEVVNLLSIAGAFVGVCEGRPEKCSLGWGRWEVVSA